MEHGLSIGTALTVFGAAFGCWAWVVGWGVSVIRKEVHELKDQMKTATNQAQSKWIEVEHRLTIVESDIKRCSVFARVPE